jgi:hypothetical protein
MWWCMDCEAIRELSIAGRCATCGSDAIDTQERIVPLPNRAEQEIADLERLWARSSLNSKS